jgi:TRAP transporter 4TM/12TM fusion protein
MKNQEEIIEEAKVSVPRYRTLPEFWRWVVIVLGTIVSFLGANLVFDWRFFVGFMLYDNILYYFIVAALLSIAFLIIPPTRGLTGRWARIAFWSDIFLFLLVLGFGFYLSYHGYDIVLRAWSVVAPIAGMIAATILFFLLIEGVRRISGSVLAIIILIAALYPVVAEYMPGMLEGISSSFLRTMQFHLLSRDSAMGTLVHLYTRVVMGYTLFGTAVISAGGAKCFLDLALSLVGATRGGTAKVAILASAMFGSISGNSIVNVLTTGSITIPAMKKAGFKPHFAGAVEVCASTAGTFTPPIMGLTAFMMASFLNVSYMKVAFAAAIPAFLYYLVLYVQVDGVSAKIGMKGLSKEERPSFFTALKEGWIYIAAIAVLLYYLFVLRQVSRAPYIATAVMLVLAQTRKTSRFNWERVVGFLENNARTLVELFVVMTAVGMLLGGLALTGVASTFTREILLIAGNNLVFILAMAMVSSFIMGMGMTIIAIYIFQAIIIAPTLIAMGITPMAAHLFILYCGMLSFITPPVALCAFPAAAISGAPAMKVARTAARLGGAIYLWPIFFVLNPALILEADPGTVLLSFLLTGLSLFIMGSAFEGYMVGIGKLWANRAGNYTLMSYLLRAVLVAGALLVAVPGFASDIIGLSSCAFLILTAFIRSRNIRNENVGPG